MCNVYTIVYKCNSCIEREALKRLILRQFIFCVHKGKLNSCNYDNLFFIIRLPNSKYDSERKNLKHFKKIASSLSENLS